MQFDYDVVALTLGPGGLLLGGAAPGTDPGAPNASVDLPSDRPDSDAVPDFLGFDDGDGGDAEDEDAGAGAEPPSLAADLLSDYVTMGLLADPAAAGEAAAADSDGDGPPPELPRAPWLSALRGISSPMLRLHQELVEFNRFVAPSEEEAAARRAAIGRIQDVVRSIWPDASVEVFGSFATGLYLPTSDVDAVILGSGCDDIPGGLRALANKLSRASLATGLQVIAKARVPIIKFEESESGYAFDVSFDVANGPEAAANVRGLMDGLPPMRPLVTFIKVFLQQRELNEVYSGGLGSYAVLVMVAAFLQTHPSRGRRRSGKEVAPLEDNLGVLLVDFFRLFGRSLAHTGVGVSCRRGGSFFSKRSAGYLNDERPYLLAIEDPNDADNDLGKNSYNASRARMAFDYAYCRLTAPSAPGESLLHRIVRLDPALFLREPKPHPPEAGGAAAAEGAAAKPGKKKKGKGREPESDGEPEEKRRGRSPAPPQEAAAPAAADERQRGKGKRRHRERSASDDEDDSREARRGGKAQRTGAGGGGRGGGRPASDPRQRRPGPAGRGSGGWRGGRQMLGKSSHIRFD